LKRVQPRRQRAISVNEDGEEEADDDRGAGTGVYAGFQTVPYEAPPIVNGRVPKNTYGNLDVYVPSMVPRGGVHLPYPEAARAAKVVGVDYADAVTGFEFKGRHGTAVIKGIVAAVEYREALEEVIEGFQNERAQAEEARRTLEALRMWRRFMAGLRVRERIDGYDVEGERDAVQEGMGKVDEEMEEGDGGGFLPDRDQEEVAEPTVGRFYFQQNLSSEDEGRGFRSRYVDEDADAEEALRSIEASPETHQADTAYALPLSQTEGGGFIIEKGLHESGGFIPEKVEETTEVFSQGKSDTDNLVVGQGLADVELAEGIILQRLHEEGDFVPNGNGVGGGFITENDPEQATSGAPERVDKDMSQASVDQDKDAAKESNLGTNSNNVLEGNHLSEGGNDEEDRGSLLSHDPEDEDADPEWLASDQE